MKEEILKKKKHIKLMKLIFKIFHCKFQLFQLTYLM